MPETPQESSAEGRSPADHGPQDRTAPETGTRGSRTRLVAVSCAAMAQHGMVLLLLGPILPELMASLRIGESIAGLMLGLGSAGFMMGPMLAGAISDRAGVKLALTVGLAVELVALLLFGWVSAFLLAVVVNMVMRFAASFVETGLNVVPTLLERRRAGSLMNLVHLFFGVGALLSPLMAGVVLETTGTWRAVFWVAAAPTLVLLLLLWRTPFPSRRGYARAKGVPRVPVLSLLLERSVLLGGLALFFCVGAEMGISNWVVLYLRKALGFPTVVSTAAVSVLWLGMTVGRYLNSRFARRIAARTLVIVSGACGLVAGLVFLLARTPFAAYALLAVFGLSMSGIFPLVMADINSRYPARSGMVTGFLAISAATGSVILQPLIGMLAGSAGIGTAIAIPGVLMGLLSLCYTGVRAADPGEAEEDGPAARRTGRLKPGSSNSQAARHDR